MYVYKYLWEEEYLWEDTLKNKNVGVPAEEAWGLGTILPFHCLNQPCLIPMLLSKREKGKENTFFN